MLSGCIRSSPLSSSSWFFNLNITRIIMIIFILIIDMKRMNCCKFFFFVTVHLGFSIESKFIFFFFFFNHSCEWRGYIGLNFWRG